MYSFVVYVLNAYGETKTIINIEENKKLSDLANSICRSNLNNFIDELNDESHLYGFTDNLKSFWNDSKNGVKYTKMPNNDLRNFRNQFFGTKIEEKEVSAYKTSISNIFNSVGKKMLFAYDFGTTTDFIIRRIR